MTAFWGIAANSAYDMFSSHKYLIVNLVFSHLGVWNGNFFLIAPFPDRCLLLLIYHLVGWERSFLSVANSTGVQLVFFVCSGLQCYSAPRDCLRRAAH